MKLTDLGIKVMRSRPIANPDGGRAQILLAHVTKKLPSAAELKVHGIKILATGTVTPEDAKAGVLSVIANAQVIGPMAAPLLKDAD